MKEQGRYLRELERKARALEVSPLQRLVNTSKTKTVVAGEDDEDFEDEQPLLEPFTNLSLHGPSTSFLGPASSDNFLRNVRQVSGFYGDDGSLDSNSNFYEPGALPSRRQCFRLHARLPPIDMARRLFAIQYAYIGTIFAFTHPREGFDKLLVGSYNGPPDLSDREGCLGYAKVLLVLAFGQLYSVNQWVDFRGPPGFEYFTDSLNLLPETHEEGSILCIETLALAGYFMQNMNRRDAAFQYVGKALRMAISLGLHHEVNGHFIDTGISGQISVLDDETREHRRRVWWSIYSLDRILTVKSGNPITIQDEDIGVNLPSRLASEPEYCPAIVLRHYTQLSRILGEIHTLIYRKTNKNVPKSGKNLMASVQSIILALSKWNREIPDQLRFDPTRISFSRESVGSFAHYYQCINMTVRPLLFHVVQKRLTSIRNGGGSEEKERDWKDGLSQTTVRVIDMCIGAAQDTVNMMAIASQRDQVVLHYRRAHANERATAPATYGYMDGEHIFSASIVLVMVCAAFPANAANTMAMNAGLSLLRGMGERGNSHMGARYELLAKLHAGVMPGKAIPSTTATGSPPHGASFVSSITTSAIAATHEMPIQLSMPYMGSISHVGGGPGQTLTFPVIDNSSLDEPFYDENVTSGMDFGLWEEGFAYPTMDLDFDLAQRQPQATMTGPGVGDSTVGDFMYKQNNV
ncbi:Transcriptional activator [Conoideocrella luteorostrata]|uniref:Transcriptional activator n=1 Tax=Conoideocrella luteorostrata TaxID=1105319 RepID=A0AAJ0CJV0_9HYPO|nr:Transcriptional activator [Conoideocrella luteorostrata]